MIESISVESALRASGRFSVTIRVCPRCSMRASGPFSRTRSRVIAFQRRQTATDLSENVTRSNLGSVALNIADLAEHAIDAVPDRVALICGDDQLTYAQLEEKANRLAHYLIDQGVQEGRQGRAVLPQPHRDRHRDARHRQGRRHPGQRQLPLRRGRAAATCSRTPTWSRWSTSAATPTGSPTCCPRRRTSRPSWWSRTAATTTSSATAASSSTRRSRRARPSATSASAAPTTSTCSTPAAPPASPRA